MERNPLLFLDGCWTAESVEADSLIYGIARSLRRDKQLVNLPLPGISSEARMLTLAIGWRDASRNMGAGGPIGFDSAKLFRRFGLGKNYY